jgi:hypothetical protein
VYVIGHQDVCVKGAIVLNQGFLQPMEIAEIIFLSKKARLAIVATLHEVQRDSIEVDTGAAGHGATLAY